jgi:hypothetical protein
MNDVEIIQTKPIPFQNGVPRNTYGFWFRKQHLKINIRLVERLKVSRQEG